MTHVMNAADLRYSMKTICLSSQLMVRLFPTKRGMSAQRLFHFWVIFAAWLVNLKVKHFCTWLVPNVCKTQNNNKHKQIINQSTNKSQLLVYDQVPSLVQSNSLVYVRTAAGTSAHGFLTHVIVLTNGSLCLTASRASHAECSNQHSKAEQHQVNHLYPPTIRTCHLFKAPPVQYLTVYIVC